MRSFTGETAATRSFRWLWAGAGAANLGDGVMLTAMPLVALAAGASPGEIALVATVATIAWPLFGLHAGWIVDRIAAPRLLMSVNAVRMLAFAGLAAVILFDGPVVTAVLAAAFVYGVAETLVDTSLVAAVPTIVPGGALTGANARLEATVNVANQLVGPPLAGWLVGVSAALSAATGSALYALAGLAAIGLATGWQRARSRIAAAAEAVAATGGGAGATSAVPTGRVRDGIVFLWRHPLQRSLTVLTAAMNLVWGMWLAVFVVHAVAPGPLGLSPAGYGWLLTAMAAGGIGASMVTSALQRRLGDGVLLFADCLGTIALVAPSALGAPVWVVAAGVVAAGAGSSVWRIVVAVIRQQTTPADLIGRVYAASRVISWGALPLGSALAGAGAAAFGVQAVFLAATAVALIATAGYVVVWRARLAGRATSAEASGSDL
ncbi:MFS transporter [Agromyces endophyticus]|uniref:MFS transporter n=1 Tax=Agromyces sp. H17E-10 TaxID=2932244 RepID=UPI001FCFBDA9|nr:MFS transporter [Agromyces sp. H17E-10]UOQ90099.1 MFS transporter [Agromyces sp. H17E-10]